MTTPRYEVRAPTGFALTFDDLQTAEGRLLMFARVYGGATLTDQVSGQHREAKAGSEMPRPPLPQDAPRPLGGWREQAMIEAHYEEPRW